MYERDRTSISRELSSNTSASPFIPLAGTIESFVGGQLQTAAASTLIEEYLISRAARPELVTAAHELCATLSSQGLNVALRYCKSTEHNHPIPIILAQTAGGDYVLPNINTVWNPAPPLEREASGNDPKRKHVIAPEGVDEGQGHRPTGLRFEFFCPNSPVCLALLPSSSVDRPADAQPIFTDQSFAEALQHAAYGVISGETGQFSVILEETIVPEVRDRIRRVSALCGEREVPEIEDIGTSADGSRFDLKTFVSLRDETHEMELHISVGRRDGRVVCSTVSASSLA